MSLNRLITFDPPEITLYWYVNIKYCDLILGWDAHATVSVDTILLILTFHGGTQKLSILKYIRERLGTAVPLQDVFCLFSTKEVSVNLKMYGKLRYNKYYTREGQNLSVELLMKKVASTGNGVYRTSFLYTWHSFSTPTMGIFWGILQSVHTSRV